MANRRQLQWLSKTCRKSHSTTAVRTRALDHVERQGLAQRLSTASCCPSVAASHRDPAPSRYCRARSWPSSQRPLCHAARPRPLAARGLECRTSSSLGYWYVVGRPRSARAYRRNRAPPRHPAIRIGHTRTNSCTQAPRPRCKTPRGAPTHVFRQRDCGTSRWFRAARVTCCDGQQCARRTSCTSRRQRLHTVTHCPRQRCRRALAHCDARNARVGCAGDIQDAQSYVHARRIAQRPQCSHNDTTEGARKMRRVLQP